MRRRTILASGVVLALAIVSTTFSLLAATSTRWSVQHYFLGQGDETTFTDIVCAAGRSPFYRCSIPRVDENGTCTLDCAFFPPKGFNQTSCRLAAEVGDVFLQSSRANGTLGTADECQQIHFAGNLQIAASAFIGVGLLVALVMTTFNIALAFRSHSGGHGGVLHDSNGGNASLGDPSLAKDGGERRRRGVAATPYLTLVLILLLVIGAILQLLAQYFGVLGLVVNASPNPAEVVQAAIPLLDNFGADDWTLDIALTRYASVAWASAAVCAAGVGIVFRTPSVKKLL